MTNIKTLTFNDINSKKFDFSVFALSNEFRSVNLFTKVLNKSELGDILLFGIRELERSADCDSLKKIFTNDSMNSIEYHCITKQQNDKTFVRTLIQTLTNKKRSKIKILIDYSVMPKHWFSNIPIVLDTISKKGIMIEVFFVYTPLNYMRDNFPHVYVNNISSNSMQLGVIDDYKPKMVFLGLGFDGAGATALLQKIESEALLFYTEPAFVNGMEETIKNQNQHLLANYNSFSIPVANIEKSIDIIEKQYNIHKDKYSIAIASLGPKPMSLLTTLICLRYNAISNVNVEEENISGYSNNEGNVGEMNIFKIILGEN